MGHANGEQLYHEEDEEGAQRCRGVPDKDIGETYADNEIGHQGDTGEEDRTGHSLTVEDKEER